MCLLLQDLFDSVSDVTIAIFAFFFSDCRFRSSLRGREEQEARESRGRWATRLTIAATALRLGNLGLRRYGRGGDCCGPLLIDVHPREASPVAARCPRPPRVLLRSAALRGAPPWSK